MTAVNLNRAIRGPVTAVPIVAGKGVRLVADTENNRWVIEADETVLWSGALDGDKNNGWTATLSELATNFEKIRICYGKTPNLSASNDIGWGTREFYTADLAAFGNLVTLFDCMVAGTMMYLCYTRIGGWDSVNLTATMGSQANLSEAGTTSSAIRMYPFRIIGINRIASN